MAIVRSRRATAHSGLHGSATAAHGDGFLRMLSGSRRILLKVHQEDTDSLVLLTMDPGDPGWSSLLSKRYFTRSGEGMVGGQVADQVSTI